MKKKTPDFSNVFKMKSKQAINRQKKTGVEEESHGATYPCPCPSWQQAKDHTGDDHLFTAYLKMDALLQTPDKEMH